MKTFLARHASPLLLVLFLTALGVAPSRAAEKPRNVAHAPNESPDSRKAYEAGRREAEKDVRENRLIIELSGMPKPWDAEWTRLLMERFHIQLKLRGCIVDDQTAGHERGYNEVSLAEIRKRYGPDLLRDTQAEAEKRWNAKQKR